MVVGTWGLGGGPTKGVLVSGPGGGPGVGVDLGVQVLCTEASPQSHSRKESPKTGVRRLQPSATSGLPAVFTEPTHEG